MNVYAGMVLQSALFLGVLFLGSRVAGRTEGGRELARKVVHVGMGLSCLGFPWVFAESWPVWVLAAGATTGLLILRWLPLARSGWGKSLHGVERWSLGELLFAPAVALVFELSDGRIESFVIPVLVLTLADAAAALAGTRWGKGRFSIGGGWKSVEGSAAFLLCAVSCVALPLWVWSEVPEGKLIWIAMTIGLLATMAEGASDQGIDNLLLPLLVYFLLERFVQMPAEQVMFDCGLLVALLVLVVVAGTRSTLDGSALLAGAVLGYAIALVAGAWFLVPLFGLFAAHLLTTGRRGLLGERRHGREAMLAVSIATLPWALMKPVLGHDVAFLGCMLGASVLLVLMHRATRRAIGIKGEGYGELVMKLIVLQLAPCLMLIGRVEVLGLALVAVVLGVGASRLEQVVLAGRDPDTRGIWFVRGCLSLGVSMLSLSMIAK